MKTTIQTSVRRTGGLAISMAIASLALSVQPARSQTRSLAPHKLDRQLQQLDNRCANGDPPTAIDACSQAIQQRNCHDEVTADAALAPTCALLFDNLGAVLEQTGRYEDALIALEYAAQLQPDDANVRYNLGVVYTRLQQYERAIVAFEEAARLDPSDTQAQKQADLLRELLN